MVLVRLVHLFWATSATQVGRSPDLEPCTKCQLFVLVAIDFRRNSSGGPLREACQLLALGEPGPQELQEECMSFLQKVGRRLGATKPDFNHWQKSVCVDCFVCNSFTSWTRDEVLQWQRAFSLAVNSPDSNLASEEQEPGWRRREEVYTDLQPSKPDDPLAPRCSYEYVDSYEDLSGTRVVAVVFTGRGSRMRALLPYLRRDLKAHQGILDCIIFALIRPDSLAQMMVEQMQRIYSHIPGVIEIRDYTEHFWSDPRPESPWNARHRIPALYQSLNETNTVYLKVDDDIVFLAKHALAEMVREKLRRRCMFVSANVVNHAILSAVHQERGAHRGFESDNSDASVESSYSAWIRVSDVNMDASYTFERHPMGSCVFKRWDCAALVHESFLDRERERTLCAFDFGWFDFHRAGFREHNYVHLSPWMGRQWQASGARWSINLFALEAADLIGVDWSRVHGPGDDEEEFGGNHAERTGGHACAVGRSLAVHFSYGPQEERLISHSDLLSRYVDLARTGPVGHWFL